MPPAERTRPARTYPDMMTVEDVARRLKMSESFVYDAIAAVRLRHRRFWRGQGGIRVSEEQLADFLQRTERGGAGEEPEDTPKPCVKPRAPKFTFLPPG